MCAGRRFRAFGIVRCDRKVRSSRGPRFQEVDEDGGSDRGACRSEKTMRLKTNVCIYVDYTSVMAI